MKNMVIALMSETNVESLLTIERGSFKNPWGKLSFLSEISNASSYNFVLTSKDRAQDVIIAYLCMRKIIDEIHILKIAVEQAHRRRGIAYQFLEKCLLAVAKNDIKNVFLEVRPLNGAALLLYHKLGFQIIGKRPKYYLDTGEDAIIMRKTIS
jgi:[ribosomal protein S18]-alanine N-acetyltransferase